MATQFQFRANFHQINQNHRERLSQQIRWKHICSHNDGGFIRNCELLDWRDAIFRTQTPTHVTQRCTRSPFPSVSSTSDEHVALAAMRKEKSDGIRWWSLCCCYFCWISRKEMKRSAQLSPRSFHGTSRALRNEFSLTWNSRCEANEKSHLVRLQQLSWRVND